MRTSSWRPSTCSFQWERYLPCHSSVAAVEPRGAAPAAAVTARSASSLWVPTNDVLYIPVTMSCRHDRIANSGSQVERASCFYYFSTHTSGYTHACVHQTTIYELTCNPILQTSIFCLIFIKFTENFSWNWKLHISWNEILNQNMNIERRCW